MDRNSKIIAIVAAIILGAAAVLAIQSMHGTDQIPIGPTAPADEGNTAVLYFSGTGHTKDIAEKIAGIVGADMIEIIPSQPYTSADLDYGDSNSRTMREDADDSSRPEISNSISLDGCSTVYLGYPIWYGDSPKIMWTFVETHDLGGKTVIPFCTSASSGIGSSAAHLKELADGGNWLEGKRFAIGSSESVIKEWIDSMN